MSAAPFCSPCDLMRAAGLDPAEVTSPAVACALDAIYAVPNPSKETLAIWRTIAPSTLLGLVGAPWPKRKMRRIVACIGRRGLKSSGILSWVTAFEMLCGGHEQHAAPGARIYGVVLAPMLAQAREATRGVRSALDQLAPLGIRYEMRDAAGTPEIVIVSPAARCERVITIMSADAVAVRGFAVAFAAFDEAGFVGSESWLAQTGADLVRAVTPGMAQFPDGRMLFASSPGAPAGVFFDLVNKLPADALLLRAPTWVMNRRISRKQCVKLAGGDSATLAQEYQASRFGYAGETFIDTSRIVMGSPHCGKGPRPGSFVIGLDASSGIGLDAIAIVVAGGFDVEIDPSHAPVRHVVVEHAESIAGSRTSPVPIEAVAQRVAELSRAYTNAPVLFDAFAAPTVKLHLSRLGFHEDDHQDRIPRPRTFRQVSMAPQHQTPRWVRLRDLVHGGRLHLGAHDDELRRQLGQLRATQQSSGSLRVEGKRDDLADALALAAEVAVRLPATGGPAGTGAVTFKHDGAHWDDQGVSLVRPRWVRTLENGRQVPAECPEWHPSFEAHARECIARGETTPAIERWRARSPEDVARSIAERAAEKADPERRARIRARRAREADEKAAKRARRERD